MKKIITIIAGVLLMTGCEQAVAEAKKLTPAQQAEVKAIAVIAKLEGFRSYWYSCSAGVKTIGYGFTKNCLTEDERKLASMDRKTADRILGREVRKIQKQVASLVTRKMTVDQEVAVISFVYNLGITKFKNSTLLKRINDGSGSDVIVAEFKRWVYGGGIRLGGLVRRRECEAKLWGYSQVITIKA